MRLSPGSPGGVSAKSPGAFDHDLHAGLGGIQVLDLPLAAEDTSVTGCARHGNAARSASFTTTCAPCGRRHRLGGQSSPMRAMLPVPPRERLDGRVVAEPSPARRGGVVAARGPRDEFPSLHWRSFSTERLPTRDSGTARRLRSAERRARRAFHAHRRLRDRSVSPSAMRRTELVSRRGRGFRGTWAPGCLIPAPNGPRRVTWLWWCLRHGSLCRIGLDSRRSGMTCSAGAPAGAAHSRRRAGSGAGRMTALRGELPLPANATRRSVFPARDALRHS